MTTTRITSARTRGSGSIEASIDRLRAFWELGRRSLEEHERFKPGRGAEKIKAAAALGIGPEPLRRARQFARQCSKQELERRIKQARRLNGEANWLVAREIYTLADGRHRNALWVRAVKEGLNHRQVITIIRARGWKRTEKPIPHAGRPPEVSADASLAYARLMQETRAWLSVCRATLVVLKHRSRRRRVMRAQRVLEGILA